MSKATLNEKSTEQRPTLVGRVSNMLKDGNYSGPPLLFTRTSMRKIRHCCQNLNLSYLLYSLENSKSHPLAKQVNLHLVLFVRRVVERASLLYVFLCNSLLSPAKKAGAEGEIETKPKFRNLRREKRKSSVFLTLAIYVAPLILAFQLLGLCSLLVFGKYTPGFIFLIGALFLLGFISMKVLFHDKRALSFKCNKRKVQ